MKKTSTASSRGRSRRRYQQGNAGGELLQVIRAIVSNGHVDLNKGLVSSLHNPYAAVPSMHIGYALIVAASLLLYGRRPLVRVLGALYPLFVLIVVVATGNHFFFDAAAGALVTAIAAAVAFPLTRRAAPSRIRERPARPKPLPGYEELAA